MAETIEDILREVLAEVREQNALLRRLCGDGANGSEAADVELVAAIGRATRGRDFSAGEVCRQAAGAAELRAALHASGADTPQRLGKALQRVQGCMFSGWRIERIGDNGFGAVWLARRLADVTARK